MTITATILNVGQGDAVLLDLPNGHFGLVDFGNAAAGKTVVAPEVRQRLATGKKFLFAVATHCDADHVGGAAAVLAEGPPLYIWESPVPLDLFEEYANACADVDASAGVRALRQPGPIKQKPTVQQTMRFKEEPDVAIVPLSPDSHVEEQLRLILKTGLPIKDLHHRLIGLRNRTSLVLYVRYAESGLLLLAEADNSQFENIWQVVNDRMVEEYKLPGLVKLSHHGSHNNNPPELFARFGVKGSLMAVSAGGRHGHPDVVVMDRVRGAGGVPACTNLGRGCELLLGKPLPANLKLWKEGAASELSQRVAAPARCHGTIQVRCDVAGSFQATFDTIQASCPFGAVSGKTWQRS